MLTVDAEARGKTAVSLDWGSDRVPVCMRSGFWVNASTVDSDEPALEMETLTFGHWSSADH